MFFIFSIIMHIQLCQQWIGSSFKCVVSQEGEGHQGSKASKVIFLRDQDRLFTTGFSRASERQYSVWSIVSIGDCYIAELIFNSGSFFLKQPLQSPTAKP